MAIKFIPRLTKPEKNNKYYIRKQNGGYSEAIQGSPTDKDCNVLSNCVGYAYGRFNEIGGFGSCKYLKPVNAENFIQYKGNLTVGQTAKVGACMVWQGGNTLSCSDGAGHVAIVEKVISDTEVITSESIWGGAAFLTRTRKKGNGNWDEPNKKFLGFIYNPAELIIEGDKMYTVYQDINGYNSAADAAARKNPTTETISRYKPFKNLLFIICLCVYLYCVSVLPASSLQVHFYVLDWKMRKQFRILSFYCLQGEE
jgi:surface antigen